MSTENVSTQGAIIWTEFVTICEALEEEAYAYLEKDIPALEKQYWRGQMRAAKLIRRGVSHPKYRNEVAK